MPFLIAGLLLFWLASVGLKTFVRANPAGVARLMRRGGGLLALMLAIFLLVRGQIDAALALGGVGVWLTSGKKAPAILRGIMGATGTRPRKISRVRSAMIEMELDHATGVMTGTVLAGSDEGASLDQLTKTRCMSLLARCLSDDPEGARLLEAYFDRRFAGWRQAGHDGGDAGRADASNRSGRRPGSMSEDEAYEVLGLAKSATREEITRSHRALMKKFHPDHGGSTDLAARVNEAKDVLMRRHL
ncbi:MULTISPECIES: DnaJ domain-containing protein [Lichenihabitans]|uniref:DnaJ domain-containing protein n=1 Tax=Lichenihabitans TaxID=2723776 RepID=UPI001035E7A7|nr:MULTISPECIES: DnaJ domain-containing protein [Lichenihabitans]UDL95053.1 DnaJ domain-containing protein [Lichenihabitans sp. PAMC28606]